MVACKCGETFASKANNRITLQVPAVIKDGYGGRKTEWVDEYTCWAIVTPANGYERFASEQSQSRVTHKITIRYTMAMADTSMGAKRRVKLDNRFMNVLAVLNLDADMKSEGKRYQVLQCVEGEPS